MARKPYLESFVVEDGIDSDLDIAVKVLHHQVTDDPEDTLLRLSYAYPSHEGRAADRFTVSVERLRRLLATVDAVIGAGGAEVAIAAGSGGEEGR